MTKTELTEKIADYKRRAENKSLPESAVKVLKKKIEEMEETLSKADSNINAQYAKAEKTKKSTPVAAPKKSSSECDEIIEEQKRRSKKAKISAHKSPMKKSEGMVDKLVSSLKNKYKSEELSRGDITRLIWDLEHEIKELKKLLKYEKI